MNNVKRTLSLLYIADLKRFLTSNRFIFSEIVEETGCESCRLLLTCRHLTAVIAIVNVDFSPRINNEAIDDSNITTSTLFPPVHPRDVLNKR